MPDEQVDPRLLDDVRVWVRVRVKVKVRDGVRVRIRARGVRDSNLKSPAGCPQCVA